MQYGYGLQDIYIAVCVFRLDANMSQLDWPKIL